MFRFRRRAESVVALMGMSLLSMPAPGSTRSWSNPNGGTFSIASNWIAGAVPGVNDDAQFNLAGNAYPVTFATSPSNNSLLVLNDNLGFDLAGNTYSLTAAAGNSLVIGNSSLNTGRLALSGGTLAAVSAALGNSGGAVGVATVSTGATWTSSGTVLIGNAGAASLLIVNGGKLTSTSSVLAQASGSSGCVSISGPGSNWTNSGTIMLIGASGAATVSLDSGAALISGAVSLGASGSGSGNVSISAAGWTAGALTVGASGAGSLALFGSGSLTSTAGVIGAAASGGGTATISNGTWNSGGLTVGSFGAATLRLTGTGVLASSSATLGAAAGSCGAATVSGNGAWTNAGALVVGRLGSGSLSVLGAGVVSSASGEIAAQPGSSGTVLLSGVGATWSNSGALSVGVGGPASLTVASGATLGGGATSSLSIGPFGTVNLSGGTISMGSLSIPPSGGFNFAAGTLSVVGDAGLAIGGSGPLGATVQLDSARNLRITRTFSIEPAGLLVLSGGTVAAGTIANSGEILLDSRSSLLGGNVQNSGLIDGNGRVNGMMTNNPAGEIRAEAGQRISFSGAGAANTNAGQINLLGGTVELAEALHNNAGGRISGRGTLLARGGLSVNAGTVALSGGQSDVLGAVSNSAKVIVTGAATATFHDSVSNSAGSEFRVSTDSTAVFLGNVNGLSAFTGPGIKDFEATASAGALVSGGSSLVGSDAVLSASHIRETALSISGIVSIQPNGTTAATSVLGALSILSPGRLDLNDNDLVIDYAGSSPLVTVANQIRSGAIHSSLANSQRRLGYADNTVLGLPGFSGQGVDLTSILIKYTYGGDSNLDGQVDISDLGALATHWQSSAVWTGGDFNYDGFIDISDLGILATNWQQGVGQPSKPSFDDALGTLGIPSPLIPEPASLAATVLGAWSLQRPRPRRARVSSR